MKILVTGGAGYIGSHTVKALLEKKHKVIVVDNLSRGFKQAIDVLQAKYGKENLVFYKADLLNQKAIEKIIVKEKPEAVMHFAALCSVSESMEKPELYFRSNLIGFLNLASSMLKNNIDKIIFSSTGATYGSTENKPVAETHPQNPDSVYGECKLIVEKMIKWFGKTKGFNFIIFRYFNVTGASKEGIIGDSKKPSELLSQNAVRGALGIEPFKLTCATNLKTRDGTPIRDYINVEDLADAHLKALRYLAKGGKSDVFNLGTGTGNSVLEIVNQVQKITGIKFPIKKGKMRKGESSVNIADISKAKKVLGWKPKRTIKDSILSLIVWYKKHPHGWEY